MLEILKSNLDINNLSNIYCYGSRVYGTNNTQSDYDFIAITNGASYQEEKNNINLNAYNLGEFLMLIQDHEISILECLYLSEEFILRKQIDIPQPKIDLQKLRSSLSAKSSNSFVKAKKKFIVEKDKDIYVGKKSLFHALRIPLFGTDIAKNGKIDYSAANKYWEEIKANPSENWEDYKSKYQPIYNSIMTEFRKVAPK